MEKKHDPNIIERSIKTLTPYARNARQHPRKQWRKIADSLEKNGQTFPILIDETGNVLVGMRGSKPQKCSAGRPSRAYILADNRLAEDARLDRDLLAIEFDALIEEGYDIELTGFDTIEIDRVLGFDLAEEADEDQVELPNADGAKP